MYLNAKSRSLSHVAGHYLAAEVGDGQGGILCRIWERIPPRERSTAGTRIDYGCNWPARRDAVVSRDEGACRYCTAADDLQVHHVIPLREFNGDVDAANEDGNLVTLCRQCHWRAETLYRETGRLLLVVLGST